MAFVVPNVALAQVVISEIMYNPSGDNAKRQWIELYNAGSGPIMLIAGNKAAAWHVNDGSSHYLVDPASTNNAGGRGSLTISPGTYAVVTSDPVTFIAEYPGGSYSVIKSAISPSATQGTITLLDDASNTVDTVSYSSDMGGSNDGMSLQKNGNAWIAAPPTPGVAFSGDSDGNSSESSSQNNATTSTQSAGAGNGLGDSIMPPPPKMVADAGSDRTVIVGADTEFKARAYDDKKNLITFSHFHWNFGDGSTSDAAVVSHHFDYPGRYVVVLELPDEPDASADQAVVTVERMMLALTLLPDGGIAVENQAGRTLDLSRWLVRSRGQSFIIPSRTMVLANATLRIPQRILGFAGGPDVELAYPNGEHALGLAPEPAPSAPEETVTVEVMAAPKKSAPPQSSVEDTFAPMPDTEQPASTSLAETASAAAALGNTDSPSSRLWWYGALGMAAVAASSLVVARRYGKREWDITEG